MNTETFQNKKERKIFIFKELWNISTKQTKKKKNTQIQRTLFLDTLK